jgi:ELWxxDGT repeat protein
LLPDPYNLTAAGGLLFFSAYTISGRELWKSDGTPGGTTLVKDIAPGPELAYPLDLTDMNGTLLFTADDGTTLFFRANDGRGYELWRSDGTGAGTLLVREIAPGPGGSVPASLTSVNGRLVFSASDGQSGYELWRSDGTFGGTMLVQDSAPGRANANPAGYTLTGTRLFFSAAIEGSGRELWVLGDTVETYVQAHSLGGAAPSGVAGILVQYGNNGAATSLVVTATLSPELRYMGDTMGVAPTVNGNSITWQLPALGFLEDRQFVLHVGLPQAAYGTRFPLTLAVAAAGSPEADQSNNSATAEALVARQVYLPARRS